MPVLLIPLWFCYNFLSDFSKVGVGLFTVLLRAQTCFEIISYQKFCLTQLKLLHPTRAVHNCIPTARRTPQMEPSESGQNVKIGEKRLIERIRLKVRTISVQETGHSGAITG